MGQTFQLYYFLLRVQLLLYVVPNYTYVQYECLPRTDCHMMLVFGMETAVNRRMLPFEIVATNLVSSLHLQCDRCSREVYRRMQ